MFFEYLLLWDDKYISSDCDIGNYSLYSNGTLQYKNNNNQTVDLIIRKSPITQNETCGEYDEVEMKKALCQYHYINSLSNLPKDLVLNFIPANQHKIWSGRDNSYMVSESKFGTYFLDYNGRVIFHGDHKDFNIDSKRLIHIPNNRKINSDFFKIEDLKKAVCFRHNLELLIKHELLGHPNIWEDVSKLVKKTKN